MNKVYEWFGPIVAIVVFSFVVTLIVSFLIHYWEWQVTKWVFLASLVGVVGSELWAHRSHQVS